MALDGAMLHLVRREIEDALLGGRVDRIHQPSRDALVFSMRAGGKAARLLLTASGGGPRVQLTGLSVDNPPQPPMFCMLLRKHIGAGRLAAIRQRGLDRLLFFDFETLDEMGDPCTVTLAAELFSQHANLILLTASGRIIDAVRRVSDERPGSRLILPGAIYQPPAPQNRLNLLDWEPAPLVEILLDAPPRDAALSRLLQDGLEGVSPLLCREIAYFAGGGEDPPADRLTTGQKERLTFFVSSLAAALTRGQGVPTMVMDADGKPRDFSFIPIVQYANACRTRVFDSYGALLDSFYGERDAADRLRQRAGDTLKLVAGRADRLRRKLALQRQELKQSADRETLRIRGDLLSAHIHTFQKGDKQVELPNLYEEGTPAVLIPLDPLLTPVQNIRRYYAEYRKADTAEKKLTALIEEGEQSLVYLESVLDALGRARTLEELDAIRRELAETGFVRRRASAKKERPARLTPFRYISSDGFTILCGRNNIQNDQLTFKEAKSADLWLHVQKRPGSHTLVFTGGAPVPDRTLEEAALVAAWHSSARASSKVPVDYTLVKFVKKNPGAKPGMVLYERFQTVIVDPDEARVSALSQTGNNESRRTQ